MLHIILFILKIIGFLILGILALLLLLTAVFLLAPFVYRAEFSADDSPESIRGSIRFHWLMHLISGHVSYEDGTFTWHIRAAWKKFGSEEDVRAESPPERREKSERPEHSEHSGQPTQEQPAAAVRPEVRKIETEKEVSITDTPKKNETPPDTAQQHTEDVKKDLTDTDLKQPPQTENTKSGQNHRKYKKYSSSGRKPLKEKISAFYERLKKIPEKIKYTFRKICDKIRSLEKKKERLSAFLQNEVHKSAFSRLLREVRRLFRFLRPSEASVDLEFGFTDPAYTGYTLAGISMIYPLIGEHAQIRPDFEHKVLKGSIFVKGKIRMLYALIFAWNMLWDKNVRTTYRHIRRFKL